MTIALLLLVVALAGSLLWLALFLSCRAVGWTRRDIASIAILYLVLVAAPWLFFGVRCATWKAGAR